MDDFETRLYKIRETMTKSSKLGEAELERRLCLYSERAANNQDIFTGESNAGFNVER
jgi:hypothetical protein